MKRGGKAGFSISPAVQAVYDDLSFSYDGNRLVSVTDVSEEEPVNKSGMQFADGADEEEEYEYDANGNMVSDKNKGIGKIMYNTLNLPETVAYSDDGKVFNYQFWLSPLAHINSVNFTYAADGTKLESSYVTYKELTVPSIDPGIGFADSLRVVRPKDRTLWLRQENTVTYAGNYQYENDTLSKKFFPDGYIDCSGGEPVACFYLKDHLGNVRMVVDENGGIVQVNDYYPFGALYGSGTGDAAQRYKYNGKELERMHGLDWYDYGARWMDPVLCRFTTMDPLCEKYYDTSPYAYCANNPMKYIDPDGMSYDWVEDKNKHIYWDPNATSQETTKEGETYLGKLVVDFAGSRQERLGIRNGRNGYITGEGAVTADITLYGPGGSDDVSHYVGYTMTSNAEKYGPIDEGLYDGNWDETGKRGSLSSHWVLNNRGAIRTLDGQINPNAPNQISANGEGYKDQIFIHRTNNSGFAGGEVSKGCLLVHPNDWKGFNDSMNNSGLQNFKVRVHRSETLRLPLQGVTGIIPWQYLIFTREIY